jgi:two-component system sensor histidine kinase DegS
VQNVLKHANAKEIKVKLEMAQEQITVLVKDNGQGFNIDERKDESFGIIGMRERVELLGGKISINSKIGKGTTVLIKVPLPK